MFFEFYMSYDKFPSVHAHSSCRTASSSAPTRAAHAGCAPPTCVCSRLLLLHPTQAAFNGEDQKLVTTILATDLPPQLLGSPPSQTVWSDLRLEQPLLQTPQTRREDQDAEEAEAVQHEDSRLLWRADKQTRTKASRSHGERDLSVEKGFTALVNS